MKSHQLLTANMRKSKPDYVHTRA